MNQNGSGSFIPNFPRISIPASVFTFEAEGNNVNSSFHASRNLQELAVRGTINETGGRNATFNINGIPLSTVRSGQVNITSSTSSHSAASVPDVADKSEEGEGHDQQPPPPPDSTGSQYDMSVETDNGYGIFVNGQIRLDELEASAEGGITFLVEANSSDDISIRIGEGAAILTFYFAETGTTVTLKIVPPANERVTGILWELADDTRVRITCK